MKRILYVFMLIVSLIVTGCAIADAGSDQLVNSGDTVVLDGSKSSSDAGKSLTYSWSQVKGMEVKLENADTAKASFVAPSVEAEERLLFKLRVAEEGTRSSSTDYVAVTVKPSTNPPVDTTPPVITLNGESNLTLYVGANYTELGATATDDIDGDVEVVITGNVDTLNVGTYTITYTATDAAGNISSKTRVIVVKDMDIHILSVQGRVLDMNSTPVVGAKVTVGGVDVLTDANGSYMISNVQPADRVTINVSHPDYMENSRIVTVADENVTEVIKIDKPKAQATFSALAGDTVGHDGASVALPADGYIDASGAKYTGEVVAKVSYYKITTFTGRAAFPGTFEGIDGNETFQIMSYGFMNVELTDTDGNPLNLDGNKTALLTYPVDDKLDTPSTIPLWYYDKNLGYWVNEGEATLQGNTYVGEVKHFTSWNLDAKGPVASLKLCVEDEQGNRVEGANVSFASANWDSYQVPTDANGELSVYNVLAEVDLTISAIKNGIRLYGEYPSIVRLSEGENRVLSDCIKLVDNSANIGNIVIIGTYKKFDTSSGTYVPAPNEEVAVYNKYSYEIEKIGTTTSATDGSFTIKLSEQDIDKLVSFNVYVENKELTLKPYVSLYNVGDIERDFPKTVTVSGTITNNPDATFGIYGAYEQVFAWFQTNSNGQFSSTFETLPWFNTYTVEWSKDFTLEPGKTEYDLGSFEIKPY